MCVPLAIALSSALLAASTLQPCRNAILLLSVSPPALLLPLDFNPVETQLFYFKLKQEHTSGNKGPLDLSYVPQFLNTSC